MKNAHLYHSAGHARWCIRYALQQIQHLRDTLSGCDWCCGEGNNYVRYHQREIRRAQDWLTANGISVNK